MKMNVLIIEDERRSRQLLKKYLQHYCKGVQVIGEAATIKDAIHQIEEKKPHLIFLDVELKDGKGIDILDHFKSPNFMSILVTGYDSYAIKAIKGNALDYILKPIVITELINAVEKAKKKLKELSLLQDLQEVKTSKKTDETKLIVQKTKQQIKVINPQNVVYIEAQNQYTKWYLKNDSFVLVRKPLFSFLDILPNHFYQIHRSYIVNLKSVTACDRGRRGFVELNAIKLPVSDRRKKDLLMKLQLYS